MTSEALKVYTAAIQSMDTILPALIEWATTMLEGTERDEAMFHINRLANDWHDLTLAMADHNGVPLA